MEKQIDMIDLILERALYRAGLIDWSWIDRELFIRGAKVQRAVLHKRMKALLVQRARHKFLKK